MFNKKILKPIQDAGYSGAGAVALGRLRNEVLAQVMMPRVPNFSDRNEFGDVNMRSSNFN